MALKPRNLDWLNMSEAFRPYFQWRHGDAVLNLCNFVMLMCAAGFGAQLFFGIPTLSDVIASGESQMDGTGSFDPTLLVFAVLAYLTLWIVRIRQYTLAAAVLFGMGGFVLWKFASVFLSAAEIQFETFADIILLPISITIGLLISGVFIWCGYVVHCASRQPA